MRRLIELKSKEVYIVGDTHSITGFKEIIQDTIPENSIVIHIGDCGIGFSPKDRKRLIKLNQAGVYKDIDIYIIRGNHDNPMFWSSINRGSSLTLVEDYTVLKFTSGKTAMCVGGGLSVDRVDRVPNVSYWEDELTPYLPEYCTQVDYMFLHDAPSYFNLDSSTIPRDWKYYHELDKTMYDTAVAQRKVIDQIVALCSPKKIVGGHFHRSVLETVNGIEYRGLSIGEIYPFRQ